MMSESGHLILAVSGSMSCQWRNTTTHASGEASSDRWQSKPMSDATSMTLSTNASLPMRRIPATMSLFLSDRNDLIPASRFSSRFGAVQEVMRKHRWHTL